MTSSHVNIVTDSQEIIKFHENVLNWYREHKRTLPWRADRAENANPYHVWLSEIMLQQTVVATVVPYFEKFTKLWPDIEALANANEQDIMDAWAGLGYYSRARNLHKAAGVILAQYGGRIPDDYQRLLKLPGIGAYTAGAISSIAFNKAARVIDGNIERVFARQFALDKPLKLIKRDIAQYVDDYMLTHNPEPHAFVQALMDLGANICIAKTPRCQMCPISSQCIARQKGIAKAIPNKVKTQRPERFGLVYIVRNERSGKVLLERRKKTGLLANMTGFPVGTFHETKVLFDSVVEKSDHDIRSERKVEHVFTHFKLHLFIVDMTFDEFLEYNEYDHQRFRWCDEGFLKEEPLPSLFKKVLKHI